MDFAFVQAGHPIIVIEVDEKQHRRRDYITKDEARTNQILAELPDRLLPNRDEQATPRMVFIRFNPDYYKRADGHRFSSPFLNKGLTVPRNRAEFDRRLSILFQTIERLWHSTSADDIITKLFFDGACH